MDAIASSSAWRLAKALRGRPKATPTRDGTARYVRTDSDGTGWVQLPGSDVLTPVNGTTEVDAQPGQTVRWHIENGRLSITGNATAPAVGATYVTQRVAPVETTATQALVEAQRAATAADQAEAEAVRAHVAADAAGESASQAQESAASAQTSATAAAEGAERASDAATDAMAAARTALTGLADVQDVVGTATWLAEHGTLVLTTDTTVAEGRTYYERTGGSGTEADPYEGEPTTVDPWTFAATEDAEPGEGRQYWQLVDGTHVPAEVAPRYVLTEDTAVQDGTDYYEAVTDPDTGAVSYVLVEDPTDEDVATYYEQRPGDPSAQGLYERAATDPSALGLLVLSCSESVEQYVQSHLALTGEGLRLIRDDSGYTVLLASDRMEVHDPAGATVASFGQVVELGGSGPVTMRLSSDALQFWTAGSERPVASIYVGADGTGVLDIAQAIVTSELRMGMPGAAGAPSEGLWAWTCDATGRLDLNWIGGAV